MIEHVPFGSTGHASSRVVFGAAALAAMRQEKADRVLELLLEHGVNHIDTAAAYGDSELRVGAWMAHHRDRFFLATKTGDRTAEGARASIERSRQRLGEECDPSVQAGYCGLPGTGHECLRCQLPGPSFTCNTDDHPSACCGSCASFFGGPGFCVGGACTQATDCGTGCCVAGQCTGGQGALCAGDGTCCPGFLCRGSFANTRCCAGPGAPCTDDIQCCVSRSCNQTTMTCD